MKTLGIILAILFIQVAVNGQQNFFNVPSSDITEKNMVFFQQQANLFPTGISNNSTLSYGIGHKSEIGLNLLGLTYGYAEQKFTNSLRNEKPIYPIVGANLQKEILSRGVYHLAFGTQVLFSRNFYSSEYYTYLNNKFQWERFKVIVGLYGGNDNYFGQESRFVGKSKFIGLQLGLEYELVKNKLYLQGDFLSGSTPISNLIIGGAYKMNRHLTLSSGYQIPNDRNSSTNGIVFEITYFQ